MKRLSALFLTLLMAALMWGLPLAFVSAAEVTVQPGESIQAAVDAAQPGDTILLQPGEVYHQTVTLNKAVTLDGQNSRISGGILVSDGDTVPVATSGSPWPEVQIGGLAAVNNTLTGDGGFILRGTTEAHYNLDGTTIQIGNQINATEFEWAVEPRILTVGDGATVKNLVVSHGANPIDGQCIRVVGDNVTLQNLTVYACSYAAVEWWGSSSNRVSNLTISGLHAYQNGVSGLGGSYGDNVTVEHIISRSNGWRVGYNDPIDSTLRGWDSGHKFLLNNGLTMSNMAFYDTDGLGLWLDFANTNTVIDTVHVDGADLAGVFVEAHCTRVTLRNIHVENVTTRADRNYWGSFFVTGSNSLLVENSRVEGDADTWGFIMSNPYRGNLQPCLGGNLDAALNDVVVTGGIHLAQSNGSNVYHSTFSGTLDVTGLTWIDGSAADYEAQTNATFTSVTTAPEFTRDSGIGLPPAGEPTPTPSPTPAPTEPPLTGVPAVLFEVGNSYDCVLIIQDLCYTSPVTPPPPPEPEIVLHPFGADFDTCVATVDGQCIALDDLRLP